jgi:hypothetical protein
MNCFKKEKTFQVSISRFEGTVKFIYLDRTKKKITWKIIGFS